jgi:sterol desaturase/sphingolipid hydroxylase (fatty acid hydroxylase superfamily)
LQTFSNLFLHLEAPIPDRAARVLGRLFMTPNLHKAHHHFKLPFTNCNFGDLLTIWDRLFGTLRVEAPKQITIGLDTHMHLTLRGQDLLWIPLQSPESA